MWWIIIGAVIALVVLIILMVIFTTKTGKLEGGLLDCTSKGGKCTIPEAQCIAEGGTASSAFDCPTPDEKCCFEGKKKVTS